MPSNRQHTQFPPIDSVIEDGSINVLVRHKIPQQVDRQNGEQKQQFCLPNIGRTQQEDHLEHAKLSNQAMQIEASCVNDISPNITDSKQDERSELFDNDWCGPQRSVLSAWRTKEDGYVQTNARSDKNVAEFKESTIEATSSVHPRMTASLVRQLRKKSIVINEHHGKQRMSENKEPILHQSMRSTCSVNDDFDESNYSHARNNWQKQQKEWQLQVEHLSRDLHCSPEKLQMTKSGSAYRNLRELHANQSPINAEQSWIMSLRSAHSQYVSVGSVFSGLHCRILGSSSAPLRLIESAPRTSEIDKISKKISQSSLDTQDDDIIAQNFQANIERHSASNSYEENFSATVADDFTTETSLSKRTGPSINISTDRIAFFTLDEGHESIILHNNGSTSIEYQWSALNELAVPVFFSYAKVGIIKPGEETRVIFTFSPPGRAGVYSQTFKLNTIPFTSPCLLTLTGTLITPDLHRKERGRIDASILEFYETFEAKRAEQKLAATRSEPEPAASEHRRLFYVANRSLNLHYHPGAFERLLALSDEVKQLHPILRRAKLRWDFDARTCRRWIEELPSRHRHRRDELLSRWENIIDECRIRQSVDATRLVLLQTLIATVTAGIARCSFLIRRQLKLPEFTTTPPQSQIKQSFDHTATSIELEESASSQLHTIVVNALSAAFQHFDFIAAPACDSAPPQALQPFDSMSPLDARHAHESLEQILAVYTARKNIPEVYVAHWGNGVQTANSIVSLESPAELKARKDRERMRAFIAFSKKDKQADSPFTPVLSSPALRIAHGALYTVAVTVQRTYYAWALLWDENDRKTKNKVKSSKHKLAARPSLSKEHGATMKEIISKEKEDKIAAPVTPSKVLLTKNKVHQKVPSVSSSTGITTIMYDDDDDANAQMAGSPHVSIDDTCQPVLIPELEGIEVISIAIGLHIACLVDDIGRVYLYDFQQRCLTLVQTSRWLHEQNACEAMDELLQSQDSRSSLQAPINGIRPLTARNRASSARRHANTTSRSNAGMDSNTRSSSKSGDLKKKREDDTDRRIQQDADMHFKTVIACAVVGGVAMGSASDFGTSMDHEIVILLTSDGCVYNGIHSALGIESNGAASTSARDKKIGTGLAAILGHGEHKTIAPIETLSAFELIVGLHPSSINSCIVNIAAGANHVLALCADGRVFSWGLNEFGQLGHGDKKSRASPTCVEGLVNISDSQADKVVQIAAGTFHSIAVLRSGMAFAWGRNAEGQCGISDDTGKDREQPTKISLQILTTYTLLNTTELKIGALKSVSVHAGEHRRDLSTVNSVVSESESFHCSGILAAAAGNFHSLFIAQFSDGSSAITACGKQQRGSLGISSVPEGAIVSTPMLNDSFKYVNLHSVAAAGDFSSALISRDT